MNVRLGMADSNESKKETAPITVLSEPPAKPAWKKTQPLTDLPPFDKPVTSVAVAAQPESRIDQIPKSLCWVLLGTSVAILILQIWNYLS